MTHEEIESMRTVALNIQRLIDIRDWTWSELASESGVSQPMISRIKNAQAEPGVFTMRRIAGVLHTSVDWLFEPHESEKSIPVG